MSLSVLWSHRASSEPRAIYEWWTENRHPDVARRWHEALRASVERLPASPHSHSFAHDLNDEYDFDIRVLLFGVGRARTHRVIYAINEESITILSIRHVAQRDLTVDDLDT